MNKEKKRKKKWVWVRVRNHKPLHASHFDSDLVILSLSKTGIDCQKCVVKVRQQQRKRPRNFAIITEICIWWTAPMTISKFVTIDVIIVCAAPWARTFFSTTYSLFMYPLFSAHFHCGFKFKAFVIRIQLNSTWNDEPNSIRKQKQVLNKCLYYYRTKMIFLKRFCEGKQVCNLPAYSVELKFSFDLFCVR